MKKFYEDLEIETIIFNAEDVITTSNEGIDTEEFEIVTGEGGGGNGSIGS